MKVFLVLLFVAVLLLPWHFLLPVDATGSSGNIVQAAPVVPPDGGVANAGQPAAGSKTGGAGGTAKTQAAGSCGASHTVQAGETLAGIAKRCGVALGVVIAANPDLANPDRILVGQTIHLIAQPQDQTTVNQNPTRAQAAGSIPNGIGTVDASPAGSPPSGDAVIPATGAGTAADGTYTVKAGDTLAAIARQAGLSVNQLMWANPDIPNPNQIAAGQQIKVPAPGNAPSQYDWAQARIQQGLQNQQQGGTRYQPKSPNEHWVHVDLATQTLQVYSGNQVVRSFLVSTGIARYPTVQGIFHIWIKLRYDEMVGPGYDLKNVPYVMYFYKGYGLHGTYWHHNFGTPMSHGCVNLATPDAAWLYNYLSVGSVVEVD